MVLFQGYLGNYLGAILGLFCGFLGVILGPPKGLFKQFPIDFLSYRIPRGY